ncbi:MAG: polyribonucleotide nucleotidyltransferase [Planctomycetota bacterium]|nr:polyribonucleotide nucleotidyltransferase [Planctomycetota bacterium]
MISRRSVLLLTSSLGVHLSGCGLLLYPERRGQPLGRLDWTVVALDTIGLCFFFVPGLIAFAVDFATGTIFLPEGGVAANTREHPALIRRSIPKDRLSLQAIEQVVSAHAQQPIQLNDGQYEMHTLEDIADFWSKHDQLMHEPV